MKSLSRTSCSTATFVTRTLTVFKPCAISVTRPFVLYSLRHTFLTRLGESGCDVWTLARIAGHTQIGISSRYVHPSEDAMFAAISRLARREMGQLSQ